jgi:hypothetical protein
LAEANPKEALNCLERSIGTWSQDRLKTFTTGRREVVFALQRIVFYPDLFVRAASVLLALAESENERWANNASRVFKGLFSLASGPFAPTATSPSQRFPVLVEALESPVEARRALALDACDEALEQELAPMPIVPKPYGIRQHIEPWTPHSHQEVLDAAAFVWRLLESKANDLPGEGERERAQNILIRQGMGLLNIAQLSEMVVETLERLACSGPRIVKTLTKTVVETLRFPRDHFAEPARDRLITLREKLSSGDFATVLRRYVGVMDWGACAWPR